jgi:hypothetical protein
MSTDRQDISPEELEDLRVLQKTQQIREMALNLITENGTTIPNDRGRLEFLTQTLNGLDDQVIKRKRLKIEDKKADNDEAIAALIEKALQQVPVNHTKAPTTINGEYDIPTDKLLQRPLVPDEASIAINGLDYNNFDKDISQDLE